MTVRDTDYKGIADSIGQFFWSLYFGPLLSVLSDSPRIFNSRQALVTAIRAGRITYRDKEWTGRFSAATSSELAKFATWDARTKRWTGAPPPDILAATVVANSNAEKLAQRLRRAIDDAAAQAEHAIERLSFPFDGPFRLMTDAVDAELQVLGIHPAMTPDMRWAMTNDYTFNMKLNIKNWDDEQITRLREMVERFVLRGYRREELRAMIEQEWGVSANKASFLARQETSLFMSKLRRERFLDAGVRRYRWSTSGDERVRDSHRELHGNVYTFGDPPIVDATTGRRAEPGEDFNCRCVAIPIID